ncbi:efflux RND transporter periplasmic adaptor subunit [Halomonas sp. BM-2019]|uniref:efflux RND transporter periplasmic adaptor subunit n=1 Tax=Halomonas sp. BM-2019 TaxID=2811227 RepID=UPI001B3C1F69|nr:MAG: efflux RND transporter periplasmic adaptor subunit [Halomonas sp. BM-2019]
MKPDIKSNVTALVAGLALGALGAPYAEAQTLPRPEPETAWVPLVQLHVVGQEAELLEIPGRVQAAQRSELSFQIAGLMIDLPVVAGQRISSGEVLGRLDPRDLENRVALETARLNLAQADFERYSALSRSPVSPVSPAEVDRRRAIYEIAQVRLEQARKTLADTTMRSPFDGVIAERLVDNHTQVQARQPVLLVDAADVLEVVVDLPDRVISRVREAPRDRPVGEAVFSVLPESRFPVTLSEVETRADPSTQTFRVTMRFDRPRDINVLPGMTVTVYSRPELYAKDVLSVPETAVFTAGTGQSSIWVVDPDTLRIEQRAVRVEMGGDGMAIVLDGLQAGEQVVGTGARQLRAGMTVRPFRVGMLSE